MRRCTDSLKFSLNVTSVTTGWFQFCGGKGWDGVLTPK